MPAFSLAWRPRLDSSAASTATRRSPTHPSTWPADLKSADGSPENCQQFGGVLEPRYIVGAEPLDRGAITHSFKDGCSYDNLLVVSAIPHRTAMSTRRAALA